MPDLAKMLAEAPNKTFSLAEVAKHDKEGDAWVAIHGFVYDVSKFIKFHPGGKLVLLRYCGKECTQAFDQNHGDLVMFKYHKKFCIGRLEPKIPTTKKERKAAKQVAMLASLMPEDRSKLNIFGELFPFGDPTWYQGWKSPYYNESHKKFRAVCREFVDNEVTPFVHRWDEAKKLPKDFLMKAAKSGILPVCIGPPWPEGYTTYPPPEGINPKDFDSFHELILIDELSRCGSGGVAWGLSGGLAIGLPPITKYGSDYLKKKVVKDCLAGNKVICLAITEPWGGSDVANLHTTAVKTADGKHYVVNGEKKWITNGVSADYFTVAVRTGGEGMGGVSLLLVERGPGVTTKQMNCMGVWASGTSYITFENVLVPVENLIGKENKGFKIIMSNFNHERWSIIVQANRFARVCLEESLKFAIRRKAFGKRLIDQPVIRAKIAEMGRHVVATHAALEDLTYQFDKLPRALQPLQLGGHTALLKVQATRTFEFCAREAAQIMGGCSYTRDGQGSKVERLYREVRAYAIPGGSEEIMAELGVRQSLKLSQMVQAVIAHAREAEDEERRAGSKL